MGIPVAYLFFDVFMNAAFGYFFLDYQEKCGCSGDCHNFKLWALVTGIILIVFAVFNFIVILNNCLDSRLLNIPLIGDIIKILLSNWTDIYIICMLVIWGWIAVIIMLNHEIFDCDKDLVLLVRS